MEHYTRMSTEDMLQYCDEALAWDQFGPVDIFFFQSVKRILLGLCPAVEMPEEDELAGVQTPVPAEELITYDENARELGEAVEAFEKIGGYTMSETTIPAEAKES